MKLEDINIILNNIESRFAVDKWEIDGIKLWPFIRIDNATLMSYNLIEVKVPNTRSVNYIKGIFFSKWNKIKAKLADKDKNQNFNQADVVLVGDGVSFTKLNDLWYEKFCDPIYDYYNSKNINTIRLDLSNYFLTPRYSPSIFIQPEIDNQIIKSTLLNKLKMRKQFKNEKWGDFDAFINDEYVREFLPNTPSKAEVGNRIHKIKQLKSHFLKQLKKIKPKIAFVVCYYSDTVMSFILACQELGIKTVDIQHGVQGEHHRAYGNWAKVPSDGYPSLPDYFWVWSSSEKMTIDSWNKNLSTHKSVICGNAFAELWKDSSNQIVEKYDIAFYKGIKHVNQPVILLTLSPGMLTEELMGRTWDVVRDTQHIYNWYIRLHPSMMGEIEHFRKDIGEKGITIFDIDVSSTLPLYSILRNAHLHITTQSSTVIEASDFGIKSIVTSEYGQMLYERFISGGDAYLCKESKEIALMIEKILKDFDSKARVLSKKGNNIFEVFNDIIHDERKYSNS